MRRWNVYAAMAAAIWRRLPLGRKMMVIAKLERGIDG
jgi:hypothetical protein